MNNKNDIKEADILTGANHPRLAQELIGHEFALDTFNKSYKEGKLHHAWLITGPRGIGKATLAWKLAFKLITGEKTLRFGVEKSHELKKQSEALSLQNVFLCRRPYDEKTKRFKKFITVDEIRKLKMFFGLSATDKEWRISLIDSADEFNKSAANALLKLLEEPPTKSIFLIIANQPGKIPKTIASRCRHLSLKKLSKSQLEIVLSRSKYDLEGMPKSEKSIISLLADGSPGKAITAIKNDGVSIYFECLEIIGQFPNFNRARVVKLAQTVQGSSEKFRFVCSIILIILSRLALIHSSVTYVEAIQQENNIIEAMLKKGNLSVILSDIYNELSKSFLMCEELNLDFVNQITHAFLLIEKKLVEQ